LGGLSFKKKGYDVGVIRDYGRHGKYQKQSDGSWKRLKKGYPTFRRTLSFKQMKRFFDEKIGYGRAYLEKFSGPALRKLLKSMGLTRRFNTWVKENYNGKEEEKE